MEPTNVTNASMLNANRSRKVELMKQILGSQYRERDKMARFTLPEPLEEFSQYTSDIVKERLAQVEQIIRVRPYRDISPQFMRILTNYEDHCIAFLKSPEEEQQYHCETLWQMEETRKRQGVSLRAQYDEVRAKLLKLRELQQLARYGDYLSIFLKVFRSQIETVDIRSHLLFSTYNYTTLGRQLEELESQYDARLWTPPRIDFEPNIFETVYLIADSLGYDRTHVVECIKAYGRRNEIVHQGIWETLERDGEVGLAKLLFRDLKEVDTLYEEQEKAGEMITKIIKTLIETFFDLEDPLSEPLPEFWEATQYLKDIRKAMADKAKHKSKLNKQENEKLNAKLEEQKEIMRWIMEDAENVDPISPSKLPALPNTPKKQKTHFNDGGDFAQYLKRSASKEQVAEAAKAAYDAEKDLDSEKQDQALGLKRKALSMKSRYDGSFN